MDTRWADLVGQLVGGLVVVVGVAGALAFFGVFLTLGRSRGRGWGHVLARWARLTGYLAAVGVVVAGIVALLGRN